MEETWEEIGRGTAKEIGIDPTRIEYIKARGFLCHELLYLLGGRVEFVLTPWWHILKRLCDVLFSVFPICRWYPAENSILECVGYHRQCETKVYRLIIAKDDIVIFFIEYQPEPPISLSGMFFPFNVPLLRDDMFLRPPFDKDEGLIEKTMREGMNRKVSFGPSLLTEEAKQSSTIICKKLRKGTWEGFIQIKTKGAVKANK